MRRGSPFSFASRSAIKSTRANQPAFGTANIRDTLGAYADEHTYRMARKKGLRVMAREPLPDEWKGVMRDRLTRVGVFLQHRAGLPPLFIVKVSRRVSVPHAAVGFGRINMYTYFGREYVLSLHLLLDGAPRSEEVECLFNPRKQKDCELLSALSISETVDVAFVVDNTKMTFLGTKRFPWPEQKRTRVRILLATPLAPRSRTQKPSWTTVVEAHRMSLDAHRAASLAGDEPLPLSSTSKIQTQVASTPPIMSPPSGLKPVSRQKMKVIVSSPLLLDRYLLRRQEVRVIDARTLDKYLWMQSAWLMSDALRHGITPILSLPKRALYIELEYPQQLYHQEVAAFSFAPHEQCWVFAVLDSNGQTIWSIHYEQHTWALPRAYHCPEQQCQTVADGEGMSYLLCELCQQRINHYPPWLVVALRMIRGDFRTQVTLQEPEVIMKSGHYTVREGLDGPTSTIQTSHTFRIIRPFDASVLSSSVSQGKRGSWMRGRPLATGVNELNPNAIIYVQIQPEAYNRTYVHDRYTGVKGTVQHVEPGPRLQPMTVAAFQRLGSWQRLTRVTASRYEEQDRIIGKTTL
jgi:hypothetical protein